MICPCNNTCSGCRSLGIEVDPIFIEQLWEK
jgi:hypothetical protein